MKKLKKFLIAGVAVIIMATSLFGCGSISSIGTTEETPNGEDRFIEIRTDDSAIGSWTDIYVDKETGVMYLFVKNGYGGGLTVMVDEDGKPLIWDEQKGETK